MARHSLKASLSWDLSASRSAGFYSDKAAADYARAAQAADVPRLEVWSRGDASAALDGASMVVTASYDTEHVYHAQLEPMNCTVRLAPEGQGADIWVGSQAASGIAAAAAGVLKTTPDRIRIHPQLMGGGFGRRTAPDVAVQAVVVALAVGKPVKLILTREDDMAAARPRPMTHQALWAGLDANGDLLGWRHRLVAENVDALVTPARFRATGGRDYIGWSGCDLPCYAVPHAKVEASSEQRGMRVQAFRGIGAGYTKFAVECFVDEIAHARGIDPLAFRLHQTRHHPRAAGVLRTVAEMAGWGASRPGRAMGLAFSDYHGTLSAGIAEVSVDTASGTIRVHRYWVVADPGRAIQPDSALGQLEGAVVWGLSVALLERLTVHDGAPVESNFNDYPVLRMADMPEIHTRLMNTDAEPTGMGEIGVLSVAPAVANAVFAVTGCRVRRLPMAPQTVQRALGARTTNTSS